MSELNDKKKPKYSAGNFDIYPERNVIRKDDKDISIEPRVMDVLCALIEADGNVVSRDELIEKHWDTIFGADESLTRVISRLRKTIREAGDADPYIETISKRGYRMMQAVIKQHEEDISSNVAANGAIPVPLNAQDDGNDLNRAARLFVKIRHIIQSRKKTFAGGGFALALLAMVVWPQVTSSLSFPGNMAGINSFTANNLQPDARMDANAIAVLPFVDLSVTGDQEYFSDGISEEILNVLSRVDGLKVASRTSSFQFKEQKSVGIRDIAGQLGVRYVLQGSVRKAGNSIRITTQLIDASSDQHLWTSTFNRTLSTENIFAIQEEIAMSIVEALNARISIAIGESPAIDVKTSSVGAYESYLKARALYQNRLSFPEAEDLLSQAVALDPNFADAWAMRAAVHAVVFAYAPNFGADIDADRAQSRNFAQRALTINDRNVLALASLALTDMLDLLEGKGDKTFTEVMSALDAALEVDPKSIDVLNWRGVQFQRAGYINLGIADHARCIEVDDASTACRYNLMSGLAIQGRDDEALAALFEALDYGAFGQDTLILLVLSEIGRKDLFLFAGSGIPQLRGWNRFGELYDALQAPDKDHSELRAQLTATFENNQITELASDILLSALGDEEAGSAGAVWWFETHKGFRRTAKFKQQIRDVGIYDYWVENGFPPQCIPVDETDFACS